MARKALWERSLKKHKYPVRKVNRCVLCGRPRGFMRHFGTCRLCFRELASRGEIVGVRKASF